MSQRQASIVGGAIWKGAWIEELAQLGRPHAAAPIPRTPWGAPKIPRADDLTRLAAIVVERSIAHLEPAEAQRLALIGCSELASLRTNERYERRRLGTGRAGPRDFPYTAPNAWLGEVATALPARGPSLCLIGSRDVGLAGINTAIRLLATNACDRAIVVAAESPPDDLSLLASDETVPVQGACAIALERGGEATVVLRGGWAGRDDTPNDHRSSVDVMARVLLCAWIARAERIGATPRAGAACWVEVVVRTPQDSARGRPGA